jgi:hypothetical protein
VQTEAQQLCATCVAVILRGVLRKRERRKVYVERIVGNCFYRLTVMCVCLSVCLSVYILFVKKVTLENFYFFENFVFGF